jgi:diphthamide synthase subunit DPH2
MHDLLEAVLYVVVLTMIVAFVVYGACDIVRVGSDATVLKK